MPTLTALLLGAAVLLCAASGCAAAALPRIELPGRALDLSVAHRKALTTMADPAGAATADDDATTAAQHVDAVFNRRFGTLLGNGTLRDELFAGLDLVLNSPARIASMLQHAEEVHEPTAQQVMVAAVALSKQAAASGSDEYDDSALYERLKDLLKHVSLLGAESCHPITRRVVLASLVQLRIRMLPSSSSSSSTRGAGGVDRAAPPWTGRVPAMVHAICRQLYGKHRQGVSYKGAIEFLHVSKSGGTSMCEVSERNGCRTQSTTSFGNCMVRRFDDKPRWVSAAVHNRTAPADGWRFFYRFQTHRGDRNCTYRDEFMRRKGYTFYSNEHAVHGGLDNYTSVRLCREFVNVVMLRQPRARLVSHLRWVMKVYRGEYGPTDFRAYFEGKDAAYWRALAPAAVDNYYVRLLLGEGTFYAPSGSLGEEHLAAARLVLLQYDLVLLLETRATSQLIIKYALGWKANLEDASARVAGRSRAFQEIESLLPRDVAALEGAQGLDTQLYAFGAVLQELDAFMYELMDVAGLLPYSGYDSIGEAAVACGYTSRQQQLLGRAREVRYPTEFPRIYSADEQQTVRHRRLSAASWRGS